jgi:hypothetical protein
MGAVYRAIDERGAPVALKVLKRELADQEEYRGRFLREAKIALSLKHPHIVETRDAGDVDGQLYIASELVEGGSLAGLLKREGRLGERRALVLTRGIVAALDHAHKSGLIHRDVKPENVLLTREEVPKLADLGLARGTSADATRYTRSGEAIGTPCYLAPEQARGDVDLDIRCDLYAVGATLYELLIGDPPYTGKNFLDVLQAHLYDPIPDPKEKRKDLSLGLRRLINDLLQKKPRDRPDDPATVLERIDVLLEGASDATPAGGSGGAGGPGAAALPPGFLATIKEPAAIAEDRARKRASAATADEVPVLGARQPGQAAAPGAYVPVASRGGPATAPRAASAAPAPAPPAPPVPSAPPRPPVASPPSPARSTPASAPPLVDPTVRPDLGPVPAKPAAPSRVQRPPTIEREAAAAYDTVRPDGPSGAAAAADAAPRAPLVPLPGGPPPLARLALAEQGAGPARTVFIVGADSLTLGRNGIDRSDNDLTVRVMPGNDHREANLRISGSHLQVRLDERGPAVVDLGSANGTDLDGQRLTPHQPASLGRERHTIDLAGVLKLRVHVYPPRGPLPAVATAPRGPGAPPQPGRGALLLEREGNREDHVYALVGGALPLAGGSFIFRGPDGLYLADPLGKVALEGGGGPLGPARCLALARGVRFRAGPSACEVRELRAEDFK